MKKNILFLILCQFVISCNDNKVTWLQEYKKTKCTWAKKEAEFKADSIQNIEKLSIALISIKNDIDKIKKPIQSEITGLNHNINQN